jgi:5-methylcytosine-specific restriction enzyme A
MDARSEDARPWRGWYSLAGWRGKHGRRTLQLKTHPICKMCLAQGKVTAATVADHVDPHKGDPDKFWFGELQSLCADHHDASKQAEEHRGFSNATGADGWPVDPKHPANR